MQIKYINFNVIAHNALGLGTVFIFKKKNLMQSAFLNVSLDYSRKSTRHLRIAYINITTKIISSASFSKTV